MTAEETQHETVQQTVQQVRQKHCLARGQRPSGDASNDIQPLSEYAADHATHVTLSRVQCTFLHSQPSANNLYSKSPTPL
jgi:hypothetical protein